MLPKDISQLILQNMQHKQTYHLFDEVHTPYFQEKHSTLIHKQRLNRVILYYITNIYINYQRPKCAVTEGQQTSDNVHRPMLHRHKNHCINEESINTVN